MNVLFVNSVEPACGVHQFGLSLWRVLQPGSARFQFYYCEPQDYNHFLALVKTSSTIPPPDLVFWNYYPCTMPWVTHEVLDHVRGLGIRQVTIFHEVPVTGFEYFIYPDPTFIHYEIPGSQRTHPFSRVAVAGCPENEAHGVATGNPGGPITHWYGLGRPVGSYFGEYPRNEIITIGSSGFGLGWKGHDVVVQKVAEEFQVARVRLNIPKAMHGDASGASAAAVAQRCEEIAAAAGGRIQLEISRELLPVPQYLEWLAGNDLNCYFYQNTAGRGIASTIDHALSVCRPLAVTKVEMMRHLWGCTPSICIEDYAANPLKQILSNGLAPLRPLYDQFSAGAIRQRVEEILEKITT